MILLGAGAMAAELTLEKVGLLALSGMVRELGAVSAVGAAAAKTLVGAIGERVVLARAVGQVAVGLQMLVRRPRGGGGLGLGQHRVHLHGARALHHGVSLAMAMRH